MTTPASLLHPSSFPANARAHVRLRIGLAGHLVPYVRPVVVLTNRAGTRL